MTGTGLSSSVFQSRKKTESVQNFNPNLIEKTLIHKNNIKTKSKNPASLFDTISTMKLQLFKTLAYINTGSQTIVCFNNFSNKNG